jgi:hypothetical protein
LVNCQIGLSRLPEGHVLLITVVFVKGTEKRFHPLESATVAVTGENVDEKDP